MKIDMVLRMRDVPGMLVKALDPISRHGGNIISVTHSRDEVDAVSVNVSFKVKDQSSLDLIRKELAKQRVHVFRIEVEGRKYYTKKSLSYILIGHVIDTDIRDTIDRINTIGLVSGIEVVMTSPKQKSSVLMDVEIDEKSDGAVREMVEKICAEKSFLLLRSL